MFKNTYQNGLLSIFFSCGSNPLSLWDTSVKNGHIRRLTDEDVNSLVLEIVSTNIENAYMVCPKGNKYLGIRLPYLVMIIKNLKRYFSFEITILDDKNQRRRFRTSNYQSTTKIKPFCTSMPIGLSGGWNQIQFNLADFTRRAYGTQYIETLKVEVHANARIRRIYFSDRLYTEDQLPQDYKLYLPLQKKDRKSKEVKTEAPAPPTEVKPEGVKMEPAEEKPPSKAPSRASVASATKPPSLKSSVAPSTVPEEGGAEEAVAVEEGGIAEGMEEATPEGATAEVPAAAEEGALDEEAIAEVTATVEVAAGEAAPVAEAEAVPEAEATPEEQTAEAEAPEVEEAEV